MNAPDFSALGYDVDGTFTGVPGAYYNNRTLERVAAPTADEWYASQMAITGETPAQYFGPGGGRERGIIEGSRDSGSWGLLDKIAVIAIPALTLAAAGAGAAGFISAPAAATITSTVDVVAAPAALADLVAPSTAFDAWNFAAPALAPIETAPAASTLFDAWDFTAPFTPASAPLDTLKLLSTGASVASAAATVARAAAPAARTSPATSITAGGTTLNYYAPAGLLPLDASGGALIGAPGAPGGAAAPAAAAATSSSSAKWEIAGVVIAALSLLAYLAN